MAAATAQQSDMLLQAARSYGADPNTLYYLADYESSFRENAVNTTDSNAKAGHPSYGLFQFIPATFAALAAKARALNPAAWSGVPASITNPQAQALTASYAITHGGQSNWSTYSHAAASANSSPVFAQRAEAGIIGGVNATVNGVLDTARGLIGTKYTWGGASPTTGFDCSGFVQYVFGAFGVHLPRTSQEQAAAATPISASQARASDLVFFSGALGANDHVGIYLGDGKMIDSPHTGASVQVQSVWPGATYARVPGIPQDAPAPTANVADTQMVSSVIPGVDSISKAIDSATSWIGQEFLVVAITGASILIGGALVVYGAITLMGGDPKKVATAAAVAA